MRCIISACFLLFSMLSILSANYHDEVIDDWYLRVKDGTELYVRTIGAEQTGKPLIVVLHGGFGAEHSYLIPAIEGLTAERQFVLYDQRGSLRSPANSASISLQNFVEDLEALRLELGVEKLTLITHSMGAVIAYAYIEQYANRVENVIFTAPVFPFAPGAAPDLAMLKALDLPFQDERYITTLQEVYREQNTIADLKAQAVLKVFGLDSEVKGSKNNSIKWKIEFAAANLFYPERWPQMRGGKIFYSPDVYENMLSNAGGYEKWATLWEGFYPALKKFDGKLTFVVGRYDYIDPKMMFWPLLQKKLPHSKLVVIEGAVHNIWIDQPEAFVAALKNSW